MFHPVLVVSATILLLFTVAGLAWTPARRFLSRSRIAEAKQSFRRRREHLEASFVCLVARRAEVDVDDVHCEFEDEILFVRHRETGEISALVGIAIEVRHPGRTFDEQSLGLQRAVAWFRLGPDGWQATERPLMNLSPREALDRLGGQLEPVGFERPKPRTVKS
ncbi:MAG: hypothetical protein D6741_10915 [Planctomycetota bacterium]|nr:MAG: hypothetical protein D6741_10915 [Planctomycetota bacterium]